MARGLSPPSLLLFLGPVSSLLLSLLLASLPWGVVVLGVALGSLVRPLPFLFAWGRVVVGSGGGGGGLEVHG